MRHPLPMLQLRRYLILLIVSLCTACGGGLQNDEPDDDSSGEIPEQPGEQASGCDPSVEDNLDGAGFDIRARTPCAGADNRALVTQVVVEFDRTLMSATVTPEAIELTLNGESVATDLDYSEGSDTVVITPRELLQPDSRYRVAVSEQMMAADGSDFEPVSWSFTTAANVGRTAQQVIDTCMNENDLEMLDRINNARASARVCHEGEEPLAAVPAVKWHCTLAAAAQTHSDDMASNNFFSHTGSDGTTVAERLTEAGYSWRTAAENIAAGQRTVEQVMTGLLDSPGHCVNIMGGAYSEVGAAVADNADSTYRRYWTQNFARPR